MCKLRTFVLLVASISLFFVGCSNKNSDEACLHQVSMDLDRGNYSAVLASSCANDMDKAAANFGLAGYDIKDVINRFSETGALNSSASTTTDLTTYMTSLISTPTGTTLTYMDSAVTLYTGVTITQGFTLDNYKDAQFCISLVDSVKALSLLNSVVPNLLDANGQVNNACDKNRNGVSDEVDATACALLVSAATFTTGAIPPVTATTTCSKQGIPFATVTHTSPLLFSSLTGTTIFDGVVTTMTGTGSVASCTPAGTSTYKRLLYKTALGQYAQATTTSDICTADNGTQWPCPIAQAGQPLDLVSAVDQSLTSAIASMGTSLSTGTTGTADVQQAITDIKTEACPTGTCTSQNIADYLQNNLH